MKSRPYEVGWAETYVPAALGIVYSVGQFAVESVRDAFQDVQARRQTSHGNRTPNIRHLQAVPDLPEHSNVTYLDFPAETSDAA